MTAAPPAETALALTGIQKVGILLVSLGEKASAELLKSLTPDEVAQASRAVSRLSEISTEQATTVLDEFHRRTLSRDAAGRGGMDYTRRMLSTAFGTDGAARLLSTLGGNTGAERAELEVIQKADPQQLAKFIHSEHPQTIALVLSHLPTERAATLLAALPAAVRGDVARRIAGLDQISPDIVRKIAGAIGQKLKSLGEHSRESRGGVRAVAEILNQLDPNSSAELLQTIEGENTAMADQIRHLMFVFEDLIRVDQEGVKEILTRVDRKVLTIALKGTSEQLQNHMLKAMSQRGADMLREDMDALGPTKIKDVETAQQQVLAATRELEAEGVLSLNGRSDDQYVR